MHRLGRIPPTEAETVQIPARDGRHRADAGAVIAPSSVVPYRRVPQGTDFNRATACVSVQITSPTTRRAEPPGVSAEYVMMPEAATEPQFNALSLPRCSP